MMTPARKVQLIRLRDWVITPAAALSALVFVTAWVDTRYLHASAYRAKTTVDSLVAVEKFRADSVWKASLMTKVDSINLRVQQIKCGPRIQEGCR